MYCVSITREQSKDNLNSFFFFITKRCVFNLSVKQVAKTIPSRAAKLRPLFPYASLLPEKPTENLASLAEFARRRRLAIKRALLSPRVLFLNA